MHVSTTTITTSITIITSTITITITTTITITITTAITTILFPHAAQSCNSATSKARHDKVMMMNDTGVWGGMVVVVVVVWVGG